jgi:predicted secreted protein with PEFG-CTERM motif
VKFLCIYTSDLVMKTKAICSFFVLFAIVAGIGATTPAAFADESGGNPHNIETADNDLLTPAGDETCLATEVGCYTPNTMTVDVGHTITMTNTDGSSPHTFTSGTVDGFAATPDDVFDSAFLMEGESFDYLADTIGEFPYYCSLHVWMQGMLIVQADAAEAMAADAEAEAMAAQAAADAEAEAMAAQAAAEAEAMAAQAAAEAEAMAAQAAAEAEAMAADAEAEAMAAQAAAEAEAMAAQADVEAAELMVTITDSAMGDGTHVELEFSELHVNYEIIATQNGETILQETAHAMEMTGANYHIDAVGSDESPIDIEIVSLGIGPPDAEDDWTGPTGTVATTQVVPEFGTIAMMILAIAIISIVAVTAKSRVIPRF